MSADLAKDKIVIRWLGRKQYHPVWLAMKQFTDQRQESTVDEIWLLEHDPVFTQGQNGKSEHVINPGNIPIVQSDRGGQVTYHGPGQLMIYTLINLKRKNLTVRTLVTSLEQSVIDLLAIYKINAAANMKAPGVYIDDKKICSIGLRIRKSCAYHGLAFNVALDLEPFNRINPCGSKGLKMTQLSEVGGPYQIKQAGNELINYLMKNLRYTTADYFN